MAGEQESLNADEMRSELAERGEEILNRALEFARERPQAAIGIAFGVGWVLGNGVPPRLIMTAARMGFRAILGGALANSDLVGSLRDALGKQDVDTREESPSRRRAPKDETGNGPESNKR